MRVGGYSFFTRASDRSLTLASYHPANSLTWHWSIALGKRNGNRAISRAVTRSGQWHDFYNFGRFGIRVGRQDWHKS